MRRTSTAVTVAVVLALAACAPAAVVSRGPADRPEVTMTFDVAYEPRYTAAFLDVLASYQVRATMFVTGQWTDANPDLVRRMAAEGHLVANHSYGHPNFTTISDAQMVQQLARADAAISTRTGRSTKPYFRPPFGAQNQRVNQILGNEGYGYDVLWTVDSLGWKGLSAPDVVKRCLDRAVPGAVFMFHLGAASDLRALPWIIQWLRDHGYTLVRLDAWFG